MKCGLAKKSATTKNTGVTGVNQLLNGKIPSFFSQVKPDQETDRLLGGGSTPIPKDVARVKSPDCRRLLHKTGSSAEDSSGRGGN